MSVQVTPSTKRPSTRDFLRVACKARGVQILHNAKNAYIDIPTNAEHGTILECSNSVCRSSGRRFRFCTVCKIPVAFRNFAKRHSHGILQPPSPLEETAVTQLASLRQTSQTVPNDTSSNTSATEEKRNRDEISISTARNRDASIPNTIWVGELEDQSVQDKNLIKIYVSPKELQWLALLHNRPAGHETDETESWIEVVLATSSKMELSACKSKKSNKKDTEICSMPSSPMGEACCAKVLACMGVKDNSYQLNGSFCSGMKDTSVVASCTPVKDNSSIQGSILSCTGKGDNCCEHIAEFDMMDVQEKLQH
jgi:hypothetical protein